MPQRRSATGLRRAGTVLPSPSRLLPGRRPGTTFRAALACLACALAVPPPGVAAQFETRETSTMRLIHAPLQSWLVPQVGTTFENARRFYEDLFGYAPPGKIYVLMHDLWDYGNAGAGPIPENHVTVGIAPYSHEYESAPAPERMTSTFNHELAHLVTVDKATSGDRFFRSVFFGKVSPNAEVPLSMLYGYLTTPRWYTPRWYLEGIAVYFETWMNGGLGRVIGPYDEMVFRTMVRDTATIYDVVGLESEGTTVDFHVGVNSYLYGTRFVSYLALRYGNDSLLAWYDRAPGSRQYFSSQFRRVYGRSLAEEWSRWIAWEREWQEANLAAIRRYPVTATRPLTDRALGSVSRAYYDSTRHAVYVGVQYPGQVAHIAAIDVASGRIERLAEVLGASGFQVTSLAFDAASRTLFYTTNNAYWRHLVALDLETRRSRVLMRDARVGDLAFNPADSSLWGVRHDNGFSTLVRVPPPYHEWNHVWTMPYGTDLFDLDVSPDGATLTGSLAEISGRQLLVRMDVAALMQGEVAHEVLQDFEEWSPSNFVFSPDGRYLFGTSYISGVSNVFRHDFATGRRDALSNAETGLFRPVPVSADSVLVFRYTGRGFVPSLIANAVVDDVSAIRFLGNEIAAQRTEVTTWQVPPASRINLDSLTTSTGPYRALRHFKLDAAYPVVEGYRDSAGTYAVAGGVRLNFSDRIGTTGLDVTSSYSPGQNLAPDERLHLRAVFRHWNWRVTAGLNPADFYDLFGPTLTSRAGYGGGVQYDGTLIFDTPRNLGYTLSVAGYGGLKTLPEYQGVAAPYRSLLAFSGNLAYGSLRSSLGAIDYELGTTWAVTVRSNYVKQAIYPRVNLDASRGFPLPLDHSSVWLRGSVGAAFTGDRDDPFANFFFGGFGNNWVDYRAIRQFRDTESFPGLGINEVAGANYGRAQVEWMLPPLRFRRVGIPSFYLRWAGLSFFATGLVTNVHDASVQRTIGSVGAQVDLRVVTISHLNSTLSLGFAAAGERGQPVSTAWMFSFKIM